MIDELDKIHPKSGDLIPSQPAGYLQANHLWNAANRTISLHAARNEFVAFQVVIRGQPLDRELDLRPALTFDDAAGGKVQVAYGRYHRVPTPEGLFARSDRSAGSGCADP